MRLTLPGSNVKRADSFARDQRLDVWQRSKGGALASSNQRTVILKRHFRFRR